MILLAIKATIVFVIAASVNMLLRRHPAALRSLIWSLAIGAVLALPLLSAVTPALHLLPAEQLQAAADNDAADTGPGISEAGAVVPSTTAEAALAGPAAGAAAAPALDVEQTLIVLWTLGALLLLARFVGGSIRARRLAQRSDVVTDEAWLAMADRAAGRDSAVELRMSAEVDMPFACGFLNPVVVIPASSAEWDAQRRETVLLHEFAHLSRGDLVMNTLSHLSRALYWFNPLAWYASHRLRIETERACDDAVLRRGARASEYADHLLSIASRAAANVPTAALAMARPSAFEGRLLAILEPSAQRTGLTRLRVAMTSAACLMFIVPLAAASPTAPTPTMAGQEPTPVETAQERAAPQGNAVAALTEALGDSSPAVRLAAVGSLGSLEDPRAIAALGKALKEDTDPRVRQAAAEALGQIDDPRAVPFLLDGLRAERIVAVKVAIVEALHEIEDPSALSALIGATRDPSAEVRRAVVNALGDFEDQSAFPAILGMARDDDVEVRRHVASALGNLENPQSLDALTAMTRDPDAEVRANAVNALGNLEDRRALNALVAALRDSNAEVRSNAANAIHSIDDIETAPPALIAALGDPDADVRHNVAHALGSIGDEAAVPALKRALSDTNVEVRRAVAEALADIGGVEAINALMGLLKDPDAEIRRTAAEALGKRR